jgi:glycosyltransferase involved in cell wall biosynthesis
MMGKIEGGRRIHGETRKALPLVSVITVVFRAHAELPELLDSVLACKDEHIEYIVIDGGSDDGTRELLSQYGSGIDYWLSEPDKGIYDAMNKGVAAAQGVFVYHINAGDRLLCIPTKELEAAASDQIDVASFRVSIDGKEEFRPSQGFMLRFNNTLHHQGTFYRRESLLPYHSRYRIFADFDVNQRMAIHGAKIKLFDRVVALHMSGGISSIAANMAIMEFRAVIRKNYGPSHQMVAMILGKWRGLLSMIKRYT